MSATRDDEPAKINRCGVYTIEEFSEFRSHGRADMPRQSSTVWSEKDESVLMSDTVGRIVSLVRVTWGQRHRHAEKFGKNHSNE
jgi:hypothetical protein